MSSKPPQSPATSLFNRRGVRVGLTALVGLYLFAVCAAYIAREPIRPDVSYVVLGPEVVEPGTTFPIRAIAYRHGKREHLETTIVSATIEELGEDHPLQVTEGVPGRPGMALVGPAPRQKGPFTLKVRMQSGEGERTLAVPLVVYEPRVIEEPRPMPVDTTVPEGAALQVEILTEGPGLAMGSFNRIWFRVTDAKGAPVPGADVRWTAKGADPESGQVETDAGGLAADNIIANQLSTLIRAEVERNGATGHLERSLRPMGRSVILDADRFVQSAEEGPLTVKAMRIDEKDWLFCDLYRGDAWRRTWHLPPKAGQIVEVEVALDDPGTYRFQCYTHFAQPGDGGDALWLFRSDESRLRALSNLLRPDQGPDRVRTYRKRTPVVGEDGISAMTAGFRTQELEVTPPAVLASTRAEDEAEAQVANERVRGRFFLLIGASFLLVLLGAFHYGVQSAIENRTRMAEAMAELGDLAVEVPPPTRLVQFRSGIQIAFIVLVLVLNIAAMLTLFKYM